MQKVLAAVKGDDEFSVFSTSDGAWDKGPVEMNPYSQRKNKEEEKETPPAGARLLQFFRGFFGG